VNSIQLEDTKGFFIISLYIVFAIQIAVIVCSLLLTRSAYLNSRREGSVIVYMPKILNIYAVLITTFLSLPIFDIFFNSLICRNNDSTHGDSTCYRDIYWLHFLAGLLGTIFHTIISIGICLLFIDLNPHSTSPFAGPKSRINLVKLALKAALPLYIHIDFKV